LLEVAGGGWVGELGSDGRWVEEEEAGRRWVEEEVDRIGWRRRRLAGGGG
jgi:hypothetical protein